MGRTQLDVAPERASLQISPIMFASTVLLLLLSAAGARAATTGCPGCGLPAMEKGAEERYLTEIAKQQILSKLHLKERPNITHALPRAALLTALRKLHAGRFRQDGTLEMDSAKTTNQAYEIVSFADTDNDSADGINASLSFQFLQEKGQSLQVLQSSLWLYIQPNDAVPPSERTDAQIFLSGDNNQTLLVQRSVDVARGGWHPFPVSSALQSFLDGGRSRLRFEVSCRHKEKDACVRDSSHQPFLAAQVRLREDAHKHALRKRSLRCGDDVNFCCKKDFYIKFRDIRWDDWIIAPDGYHMNYCMGQCPPHLSGSPGIASSFHATIFSQLKANGLHTAVSSCCIPVQRRPLSMVFFDSHHTIVKTDVPDMIVESCGCT
ncbi:hypothetical protein DNTS_032902 [Danionella cerebrum]|uniref:TGF-beta family profile domain-containing protein n=1 Tax=Danionella cerebrum TaxID=2873325 RepID=A0A553R5C9_9TELE|nr:hypothetical protein DNTS_032902 [Danionella translucida]